MRAAIIAFALIAAGCGQKTADAEPRAALAEATPATEAEAAPAEAPVAAVEIWPEGFPKPSVDYAGVYDFAGGGQTREATMRVAGLKQRLSFPPGSGIGPAGASWSQAMVNENSGERMMMWPEGEGAPKIATLMSKTDLGAMVAAIGVDEAAKTRAVKTGTDEVAGERCAVYEIAAADDEPAGGACVTRDGIPLRVVSGGQTVMLAKSITRGPQDPALFAPPAGYEVLDMGECMRIGAEMMQAMRSGKTPDMSVMGPKMEKCQALGEKMGAMMGQ
ncbi:MAG: hypothetical protein KDE05_00845 [Parvularculaceae bacterium]|nr:hypothetical protein [Parvularculaceae bacterium]